MGGACGSVTPPCLTLPVLTSALLVALAVEVAVDRW